MSGPGQRIWWNAALDGSVAILYASLTAKRIASLLCVPTYYIQERTTALGLDKATLRADAAARAAAAKLRAYYTPEKK